MGRLKQVRRVRVIYCFHYSFRCFSANYFQCLLLILSNHLPMYTYHLLLFSLSHFLYLFISLSLPLSTPLTTYPLYISLRAHTLTISTLTEFAKP